VVAARDGSPVELYELLPERGEGELVAAAVPPPATILELGCGTGRMTRQLVARGFDVTAVDESAEMLARVRVAKTVHARIEELDLGRRFDAVLLASNLLSDDERRRAFLESCLRHGDTVVIETLPLGWQPSGKRAQLGAVTVWTRIDRIEHGRVHGAAEYEADGRRWTHPFVMRVFMDEAELGGALADGGLRFDRWLERDRGWFVATGAAARL
jgi:SAM-dependent methyltransferase